MTYCYTHLYTLILPVILVLLLFWSSTLIDIVTHLYYIGIILVIPIGTMLPFIDNIGIVLILYYIGYTHWYNVAHSLILLCIIGNALILYYIGYTHWYNVAHSLILLCIIGIVLPIVILLVDLYCSLILFVVTHCTIWLQL